ncbi:hypothetical protein TSMEX_004233 [Taenia solium]|eukprot:TsM_000944900 transcript=TsM_000944900 gene=TsM_000944900
MHALHECVLEDGGRLGEWKLREADNGEEVELNITESDSITWTENNIKEEQKEEGQREKGREGGKEKKAEWRSFSTKDKAEEKVILEAEALAKTEETKKKKDRRNGKKGEEGLVNVERSVEVEADVEARWVVVVKTEE